MKTIRLQFDMPEYKLPEIERLMEECEISNKKDLFNNALTLLKWAVRQVKEGNRIASVNDDKKTYRELEMPILSAAAAHAQANAQANAQGQAAITVG